MTDIEREELLERWIKPSSSDEEIQQDRAIRMVGQAIEASELKGLNYRLYAKGSYANQTNVKRDSDVDIAIDCYECVYYESFDGVVPKVSKPAYTGPWKGIAWRNAVEKALRDKFKDELDSSGNVAFYIPEVEGSRPNIDVVPGFHYRRYRDSAGDTWYDGQKVFTSDGKDIINWPQQQLDNGESKDTLSSGRYKEFVRALKSAENRLVELGKFKSKPSFLMECLVFNVQNTDLTAGTLSQAFKRTLLALRQGLDDGAVYREWLEPSWRKYVFRGDKKWTVEDAKAVVDGAWELLEYS